MFSFSTTSWVLFGLVAIVVVAVVWKFWKSPGTKQPETEQLTKNIKDNIEEATVGPPPDMSSFGTPPPPMVFAVNDAGNFDLSDVSGKLLNIGFGPNPKTYINLLDQAEKDIIKTESGQMTSNVGSTKTYEVAGRPYIVNFTRLM